MGREREPELFSTPRKKPVEMVSWFDAVHFCNQLSEMLNVEPAYEIEKDIVHWNRESCGFRLPTEVEWESVVHIGTPQNFVIGNNR